MCAATLVVRQTVPAALTLLSTRFGLVSPGVMLTFEATGTISPHGKTVM